MGLGERRGAGRIASAGMVLEKHGFLPPLHPQLWGCSELSGFGLGLGLGLVGQGLTRAAIMLHEEASAM